MSERNFSDLIFVVAPETTNKGDCWYTPDNNDLGAISIKGIEHKIVAARPIVFGDIAIGEDIVLDNGDRLLLGSSGVISIYPRDFESQYGS